MTLKYKIAILRDKYPSVKSLHFDTGGKNKRIDMLAVTLNDHLKKSVSAVSSFI